MPLECSVSAVGQFPLGLLRERSGCVLGTLRESLGNTEYSGRRDVWECSEGVLGVLWECPGERSAARSGR